MWNVIICDMKWPLNNPRKYGKLKVWWIGKQPGRLSGHDFHVCLWDLLCGCGASRQVGSISISKNKAPLLLLLHRVKWSLFIHFHCFLLSQPKFSCGCSASRKAERIFISKNKAPPLWLNRVKWSPFIYFHCFYYHSQS